MERDTELLHESNRSGYAQFRVYTWAHPTLSYGRLQKKTDLDISAMDGAGIYCIQRPTGGRALFHEGDLCFSFALGRALSREGRLNRKNVYHMVSHRIVSYLTALGISVQPFLPKTTTHRAGVSCFLIQNGYEIGSTGKKCVGIALAISAEGILLQGSIPLTPSYEKIVAYVVGSEKEKQIFLSRLQQKTVCLETLLGRPISSRSVGAGLCRIFGIG